MRKALVLYHSLFGNTEAVAKSLAKGIEETGMETLCQSIDDFNLSDIRLFDFVAIGGPTHILKTSKEMKLFLQELSTFNLRDIAGFSFDTRNESKMNKRRFLVLENSAARVIEGWMKRMKMTIIRSRESAIVNGREGPLDPGVEDAFLEIGREIGKRISASHQTAHH
jgi:sulfite reductase alpha subunit-like flavoprotein